MKREVKAPKETAVTAPQASRALERQFAQATASMIQMMARIYRNQALEGLNKSTVEKFADSQVGNYAAVFTKLAERVSKKLTSRFDNRRIEKMTRSILEKADASTREKFYKSIGSKVGLDPVRLMAEEGMKATTNALMLETAQWVKKLRDETLEEFTANSLRAMALGKNITEVMAEYDGVVGKRVDHAKFVARNQVNNYASLATKIRAQNLGITRAVWVTTKDNRLRGKPGGKYPNAKPSHHWAEGKEFDLAEGLTFPNGDTLIPGVSYLCRCKARYIIPEGD